MQNYIAKKPDALGKWLVGLGLFFVVILLIFPLALIFATAFKSGWTAFTQNLFDKDMISAIQLTILVAVITVPVNLIFGTLVAWCVTKFRFVGRKILIALIDTPYAISPVVAGLCYLLLYGNQGWLGSYLSEWDIQVMFAWPGIVLVTIFVTCPYVARELIPLMEAQGKDEEEAAILLGASGWKMFWNITVPNIKYALLYGAVLTTARAVGEFGSVAVVSGSIRGETNTLPLQVQLLHQDYNAVGAYTAALLLACFALLTLVLKTIFEWVENKKLANVKSMQ